MNKLQTISPSEAARLVDQDKAIIIDIRERDEYAREHIAQAQCQPLSSGTQMVEAKGRAVIFSCLSGNRTACNAAQLSACVEGNAYILKGGINGWKSAGLPTELDRSKPLELMRQVQIIAGTLILCGVILGTLLHPAFYAVSGFVGAGLMVAGITGFCGMARLLLLAPWNRTR